MSAAQVPDDVAVDVPIFEVMDAALKARRRGATVVTVLGLVGLG